MHERFDRGDKPVVRVNILPDGRIEMITTTAGFDNPHWLTAGDLQKIVAQIRCDGSGTLKDILDKTPPAETLSTAGYEIEEQAKRRVLHQQGAERGEESQRIRVEQHGVTFFLYYYQNATIAQHMLDAAKAEKYETLKGVFTYETQRRGKLTRADLPESKLGGFMTEEVRVQFRHLDTVRDVLAWAMAEGYGIDGELLASVRRAEAPPMVLTDEQRAAARSKSIAR